jgi:hypothetical protein
VRVAGTQDELLGFGLVPVTALRSIEAYEIGSLQAWVDAIGALAVGDDGVEDQQ